MIDMNKLVLAVGLLAGSFSQAQINAPKLSPTASVEQTIGLTEVEIEYSRPSKRDRVVFGELVPYDEIWRTGANENTTIETDGPLIFGKDTLQKATYAIYTKPGKSNWTIYFYAKTDNWGNPEVWEEDQIVLETNASVISTKDVVENFTIGFDAVTTKSAMLIMSWDQVKVAVPFTVTTDEQMAVMIDKVMAGPSANDYYRAADYYLNENIEQEKALEYMNKAIELRGNAPFWMLRKKSLILANLGRYKEAIAVAEESLKAAEAAGNQAYVDMNKKSIEAWKKK